MSNRPFKCSQCGNWYIAVSVPEDVACLMCMGGSHTPHPKTGLVDCHFGQESATPSEVKMMMLLALCQGARDASTRALVEVQRSTGIDSVKAVMARVERTYAEAEQGHTEMPEVLRWASVFEMPGMDGAPRAARFKDLDAMQELANTFRRPIEDVTMLRRSEKVCREIATEVSSVMSDASIGLGQARQAAQAWKAPQDVPMPENVPSTRKRKPRASVTA